MLALSLPLLLMFVCTVVTVLSIAAVWHITRSRRDVVGDVDLSISVLKPLCGADDSLEANLETFFRQSYPQGRFELVFGVEDAKDPAVAVVERLMARHPAVTARVVAHGRRGLNPKVANLRGMLQEGAHDVVVVSDSNIAVEPEYLAKLATRFHGPVGLVTSLFAGVGEKTLGSTLESLQLCGPVAGGIAASEVLSRGCAVVVGKSMMFRRSVFEALGGMESLASVLAEDYVMGRMFKEAGYEVRICADVVRNVTVRTSLDGFVKRQVRWGLLRSRIKPLLYPFEILINPTAVALLTCALAPSIGIAALVWAFALTLARDALQWVRLRGARGIAAVLLGVPKDLVMIGAWLAAPFLRTISWRGHKLRVSAGTRLYAEAPVR